MSIEVDFITLGDVSNRIDVPSPTLRHWTDQLEEYEVHFTLRNNRNERIYNSDDILVFMFLKQYKEEFGRRTTTKDLARMLQEKGREGEFKLRLKEDAPSVTENPSNKTQDLLNQDDIKRLMQSERVKQFIGVITAENNKFLKEELMSEVATYLESNNEKALIQMKEMEEKRVEGEKRIDQKLAELKDVLERVESHTKPAVVEKEKEPEETLAPVSIWKKIFG